MTWHFYGFMVKKIKLLVVGIELELGGGGGGGGEGRAAFGRRWLALGETRAPSATRGGVYEEDGGWGRRARFVASRHALRSEASSLPPVPRMGSRSFFAIIGHALGMTIVDIDSIPAPCPCPVAAFRDWVTMYKHAIWMWMSLNFLRAITAALYGSWSWAGY